MERLLVRRSNCYTVHSVISVLKKKLSRASSKKRKNIDAANNPNRTTIKLPYDDFFRYETLVYTSSKQHIRLCLFSPKMICGPVRYKVFGIAGDFSDLNILFILFSLNSCGIAVGSWSLLVFYDSMLSLCFA